MEKIITVGLDWAKSIFSSSRRRRKRGSIGSPHVATIAGTVVLSRLPACLVGILVGMEACASAHRWAREIAELGHSVRMMPPAHVKPFVKQNKTDVVDAEAIC